jgi:hypothetical protein
MMQRSKLRLPEYQASSRQEALGAQLTWGFMIASKSKSHRSDISSSITGMTLKISLNIQNIALVFFSRC